MKYLYSLPICALLLLSFQGNTQSDDQITSTPTTTSNWKLKSIFGANGTQSSFVNWNAGGRNNISVLGYINASANYKKNHFSWDNDLGLALGGLQYIGANSGDAGLQKTDDKIDIASKAGYEFKEHWYYSFVGGFKTQILDGFQFPNDSVRVSTFLAPGYVNIGLGIEYKPSDNFTLFISPLASKMTFVRDETLANAGSFGVTGATYDATNGDIITAGKMFRGEFGAYLKSRYTKDIAKNINMIAKLELFSNYLDRPENIDVNGDLLFTFKVNSWFQASLNWTMIYDHDINIVDAKGNVGPRTQFKSVLGVGVSYTMKN
jgi:hypothetical protein